MTTHHLEVATTVAGLFSMLVIIALFLAL